MQTHTPLDERHILDRITNRNKYNHLFQRNAFTLITKPNLQTMSITGANGVTQCLYLGETIGFEPLNELFSKTQQFILI